MLFSLSNYLPELYTPLAVDTKPGLGIRVRITPVCLIHLRDNSQAEGWLWGGDREIRSERNTGLKEPTSRKFEAWVFCQCWRLKQEVRTEWGKKQTIKEAAASISSPLAAPGPWGLMSSVLDMAYQSRNKAKQSPQIYFPWNIFSAKNFRTHLSEILN